MEIYRCFTDILTKIWLRKLWLVITDAFIINISIVLSLLIRFDFLIQKEYSDNYLNSFIILTLLHIVMFYAFGLYRSLWRFAGIDELIKVFSGTTAAIILSYFYGTVFKQSLPRTTYLITLMISFLMLTMSRFSYRLLRRARYSVFKVDKAKKLVMIVGAGEAGSMVIKELNNHPELNTVPVIAVDDDKSKHKNRINGVEVAGGRERIVELVRNYKIDEIILAIPSAAIENKHEILCFCKQTGCKLRILPGVFEILQGETNLKQIRDVNIEDLLGRDEIILNNVEVSDYLKGETVLVTGAGGSIGSELCRQIAKYSPRLLLIFDIYENNAYEIQNELSQIYKNNLNLKVIIGSVREKERLRQVFEKYKPGVVFHAAAHKHVPLMEDNPSEAVKNNVLGTLYTAQCADEFRSKKFVLISTDKAVNPTSIMGKTKRAAEIIIQSMYNHSRTEFTAVRFGNVLESNGSVIPLFRKQIARGGPVTVTHPEVERYFMTIPEASRLVIQAGAMAKGGEIYILDMGKPIKILELAKDMIRLSGLEPGVDIKIEFTGLRSGEKLFEELLLNEEGLTATRNDKIYVCKPIRKNLKELLINIRTLENCLHSGKDVRESLSEILNDCIRPTDLKKHEITIDRIKEVKAIT